MVLDCRTVTGHLLYSSIHMSTGPSPWSQALCTCVKLNFLFSERIYSCYVDLLEDLAMTSLHGSAGDIDVMQVTPY